MNGATERRVPGASELQETLGTVFHLKVPDTPDLRAALTHIVAVSGLTAGSGS